MELSPELFTKKLLSREELDELTGLGYFFEKGIYFKRDYKMAHKIYERCASFGFGRALNNLGWLYQNGLGVKRDIKKAEDYYQLAAMDGNTTAMINIGNIYEFNEKGLGKVDWKKAKEWYHRAALLGDNKGKFNYANCLHFGYGGPKDRNTAFFIYHQLAGVVEGAYFYLGLYYENGFVIHKNIEKAADYYLKGLREENDGYCAIHLGNILAKGSDLIDKNYKDAAKYYFIGITNGDSLGYVNIGYLFESGKLTTDDASSDSGASSASSEKSGGAPRKRSGATKKRDLETAIKWYQLGAKAGEQNAKDSLKRLGVKEEAKLSFSEEELIKEFGKIAEIE